MKPIATWCFEPYIRQSSLPWQTTEHLLVTSVRALELVNNHYSMPTVYTDSLGCEIFSSLTDKATFINAYDNLYDDLNPKIWVLPKLLTYQAQQEPYFHFDLDFLCLERFSDDLFDCDLMAQHLEVVTHPEIRPYYNLHEQRNRFIIPEIYDTPRIDDIGAPNLGCLYMSDMEFNKLYADMAIDIIEKNRDRLNNTDDPLNIIVIEQQLLGLLIDKYQKKLKVLMPEDPNGYMNLDVSRWGVEFIHFCGPRKHDDDYITTYMSPYVTREMIEAAKYINSLMTAQ